ncbi:Heptaprenylglyceryl phosphate synthase, partial [Bienertia sinuspersici]
MSKLEDVILILRLSDKLLRICLPLCYLYRNKIREQLEDAKSHLVELKTSNRKILRVESKD